MELESAAEREAGVHSHAHLVASAQLGCGCPANIGLKRDVVYRFLENWRRLLKISTPPRKTRSSTTSSRKPFPRVIPRSAKSALVISTSAVKRSLAVPTSLSSLACPLASTAITGCRRASSRTEASASASGTCCAISDADCEQRLLFYLARFGPYEWMLE